MKIGLLTYGGGVNYGATLQAYSTYSILKELGHEPAIINIGWNDPCRDRGLSSLVKCHSPAGLFARWTDYRKEREFAKFRKNFSYTDFYASSEALVKNPPKCDAYVCGSDTIWSPRNFRQTHAFDPIWFLGFGGERVGRIAYAPSFWRELPDEFLVAIKNLLLKFDSISVREEEHARKVAEALKISVPVVCDPAVLYGADGMRKIIDSIPSHSSSLASGCYALTYPLGILSKRDKVFCKELRRRFGENVILGAHWALRGAGRAVFPNPAEYLALIQKSSFVLTSAFHGTVYAILAHRPFVTLGWPDRRQNIRVKNLLLRLGLQDRFVEDDEDDKFYTLLDKPIEWSEVDRRIHDWQRDSMEYLTSALAKVERRIGL